MSRLKPNAREDNNVQPASDSPGHIQEPLQSHTLSQKNNAAGLSSDEHENPLNGTQPKPFVYSSVPAVPHAGNSLPSGALVNGPGSHPTSEVHCVLNKGTVLSNNVLDATWQPGKDTSPEVLPPPRELQSDAWKNTAGPVVKTPATQPGANTPPPPHSQENESKLASSALSGCSTEQMRISQPLTKQTIKAKSRRDVRRSESSSDDDAGSEAEQRFVDSAEKVYDGSDSACFCFGEENVLKGFSRSASSDSEHRVCGAAAPEGFNEEDDAEEEDTFTPKQKEQLEEDLLLFSCSICNVNFKAKSHFHRHMMYHLDKHNQVNRDNVSQPFICRECGRLFCDSNSLVRHIIIHQDRLEKLMEQIKALQSTDFHDGGSRGQCPGCVFGCEGSEIFVQRATTRDNLRHYYFCGECSYITLTRHALEAHLHAKHLSEHPTPSGNAAGEAGRVRFCCKMGGFACRDKTGGTRQEEAEQRLHRHYENYTEKSKFARSKLKSYLGEASRFRHRFSQKGNICDIKSNAINSEKATEPSQLRCCGSYAKNTLPPSLWKIDKHGKLHLQPANTLDVATDLTCVEQDENNNDHEAFGNWKQANSPGTVDFLLSTRNLKLDQMVCEGSGSDPVSGSTQEPGNPNSPLVQKISAPLHISVDNMHGDAVPRLRQRPQRQSADSKQEKASEGSENFSGNPGEAGGGLFESGANERNPYARRYCRKRQRFSAKDQCSRVLLDADDGDEDCSDIEQLVIKEESVEAAPCDDSSPTPEVEHKRCPYCPAVFESGVGLSNHVRGHLHRLGLTYDARHMVSPEQVALREQEPRIRRRIATGMRRLRKVVKSEAQEKHSCPLCRGCFDTKTGLSNHVRGHLKRIGRSVSCSSKSPLCILNDLLQDKVEQHSFLQVTNRRHFPSGAHVDQNFSSSSDVLGGLPVKLQCEAQSPINLMDRFVVKQEAGTFSSTTKLQIDGGRGGISSTLVKLMEENHLTHRNMQDSFATGEVWDVKEDCIETSITSLDASKSHGYDYIQKTPRPRAGLKKRILPPLNAEIYTLTCRFCDLVFQGPLSIQEDWIKHLQRHLQHTGVPNSGTGMVEVVGHHCKNTNWPVT